MIQIVICEDEIYYLNKIKTEIEKIFFLNSLIEYKIATYLSGEELCKSSEELEQNQVFFLDINMPNLSGIEVAEKIRKVNKSAFIVFITAYIDYAVDGYKVEAIRFILKDMLSDMLKECIETIIYKLNMRAYTVKYNFLEGEKRIYVDDIFFVESSLHKVIFHIDMERLACYSIYKKLDCIQYELEKYGFLRIHKSYLVNMKHIKEIERYQVISDVEWLKFLFFPMFAIMSMLLMIISDGMYERCFVFISFGLMLGNLFIFYMIRDIMCREKELRSLCSAQERTKNQTDMYHQMAEYYEEQKRRIHEYKNDLGCIQGLLESNEAQKALSYIANINNTWIEEMNYVLTNHVVVNAVLNQKYKQAKMKGIPIVFILNDMEKLEMKDADIVTLLTNLLNNAIEAVEPIKSGNKIIKFKMTLQDSQLNICIRNPISKPMQKKEGKFSYNKKPKR